MTLVATEATGAHSGSTSRQQCHLGSNSACRVRPVSGAFRAEDEIRTRDLLLGREIDAIRLFRQIRLDGAMREIHAEIFQIVPQF
jgi:hypothetical protein